MSWKYSAKTVAVCLFLQDWIHNTQDSYHPLMDLVLPSHSSLIAVGVQIDLFSGWNNSERTVAVCLFLQDWTRSTQDSYHPFLVLIGLQLFVVDCE